MDVSQRPVVVTLALEDGQGRGRIIVMSGAAVQGRMEQADVETVRNGGRIGGCKIIQHGRREKTLSMRGDADLVENDGFGLCISQQIHVARQAQGLGKLACCVVITAHNYDGDTFFSKLRHPLDKKSPVLWSGQSPS